MIINPGMTAFPRSLFARWELSLGSKHQEPLSSTSWLDTGMKYRSYRDMCTGLQRQEKFG